jgi:GDP-L-fucose synthase
MNILITGSNGFIGRNLSKQLASYGYKISLLTRTNCDLLDNESVNNFFREKQTIYDLVIHTAIKGGRRTKTDDPSIVFTNLLMLYNLLSNQTYYNHIISFGSGAEFDRRYNIDLHSMNHYPIDPYGLSKSIIDKLSNIENKLCNFRIFNCFGSDEAPDRMIKANIIRYINKEPMVIYQNRQMDFFYIDDLGLLIDYCLKNSWYPKNINCCYKDKIDLISIASIINELSNYRVPIIVEQKDTIANSYTGNHTELPIQYTGLSNSIKKIYYRLINI